MKPTVASFLAVLLTSSPAIAESLLTASDAGRIVQLLRGFGTAELHHFKTNNEPFIRARMGAVAYRVFFYGCKDGRDCSSIQFYAAWKANDFPVQGANEWNRRKRFSHAAVEEDGDINISLDVNLRGGVTEENFLDTVDMWRISIQAFRDFIKDK